MIDEVRSDAAALRAELRQHYEEKKSVRVGTGGASVPLDDEDLDWS